MDIGYKSKGLTPLILATIRPHIESLRLLITVGEQDVNEQTARGETALYFAALFGHCSAVSFLLDNGANPHLETIDGQTPLMAAQNEGHTAVVKMLLNAQASKSTVSQPHRLFAQPVTAPPTSEQDSKRKYMQKPL